MRPETEERHTRRCRAASFARLPLSFSFSFPVQIEFCCVCVCVCVLHLSPPQEDTQPIKKHLVYTTGIYCAVQLRRKGRIRCPSRTEAAVHSRQLVGSFSFILAASEWGQPILFISWLSLLRCRRSNKLVAACSLPTRRA